MDISEVLINKMNNRNCDYVKHLSEIIIKNKFSSIEDLKNEEDKMFTVQGKVLDNEERVMFCLKLLGPHYMNYEILEYEDIFVYDELVKFMSDSNVDIDKRILASIKVFELTKRNMMFLVECYNYILDGEFDK